MDGGVQKGERMSQRRMNGWTVACRRQCWISKLERPGLFLRERSQREALPGQRSGKKDESMKGGGGKMSRDAYGGLRKVQIFKTVYILY